MLFSCVFTPHQEEDEDGAQLPTLSAPIVYAPSDDKEEDRIEDAKVQVRSN